MSEAPRLGAAALPPWLAPNWSRLMQARRASRLPHALLVAGPRGVGKRLLVDALVRAILCVQPLPEGAACGRCPDCSLVGAGCHPDLIRVGPDPASKSGEVPIESIRDLRDRAALTPGRGGAVLVVIDPADRMTTAAANALLKTLEEPPGPVHLCLIAEQPGRLPATVRSRCLLLRQPLPPREQALVWLRSETVGAPAGDPSPQERLALARGAPLQARDGMGSALVAQHARLRQGLLGLARGQGDPVAEAAAWSGVEARLSWGWFAGWLCDLLRLAAAGSDARLVQAPLHTDLAELAAGLDRAAAHRLLQRVLQSSGLADSTVNPQLRLESLLVEWSRLFAR